MPANWNAGSITKSSFSNGYLRPVVLFEPVERLLMQIEDRLTIGRDFCRVRLPVIHRERVPVALVALDEKLARGEPEEVRRQRLRRQKHDRGPIASCRATGFWGIRDSDPLRRDLQR